MENIASAYILKIIFNNIDEKRKLNIVKYNKNIQNKIDINIKHYKNQCKKYFIRDKNGKVKEYNNDDYLIYEGDYQDGKKNGEGKEYNYNILIFEGEYKDGKRNGKATKYYYDEFFMNKARNRKNNSKIEKYDEYIEYKFVGVYLNGKKWNGKEYDKNNNIIYELNYGKGYATKKIHKLNKTIYEGEYLKGKKHGKGRELTLYGIYDCIYEGEYLDGKKWNGKIYSENNFEKFREKYNENICICKILKGNASKYVNDNSQSSSSFVLRYEGEFENGEYHGKGVKYNSDGLAKKEVSLNMENRMEKEKNIMIIVIKNIIAIILINYYMKVNF